MNPENEPGFDIHASQRGRIVGAVAAIFVITTTSVALRFLSRKLSRAGLWWDDYLCLVALVVSLMCPALCLYELRDGFGRHIYIYSPSERIEKTAAFLKEFYVFEILFHTATILSKFAILLFYYRIFPVPRFRRLLAWVMGICGLYVIAVPAAVIFQCRPIHYAWDQVRPGAKGHCFHQVGFFIGSGSLNAVLNFVIFVLPMPLLRRLRTTARQQLTLLVVFTLAGFVVLVSIIWVIVVSKLYETDVTWKNINTGIWTALEPNMAVVCACIPSLRPLFSIIGQGFSHAPRVHSNSKATTSAKRIWSGMMQSNDGHSELDDSDDQRPLGHGVSIRGGKARVGHDEEEIDLPQNGIAVKTEVTLVTTDRLYYNDRLF